ncbi:5182_t:CDS:2 [Diversispora eburnea]|uniref:5182_t:CDS:1 n=1 Tax=Diversispora eburnea TaxID=1213867 RepID=A0A9N8ZT76_9GLOM|nr:5182_t:CDS:2 [Diversispora eburnea]
MNFASPENIKIIKLLRSNIIPPESIQNMRLHIKSLIVEAEQDNSNHDNVDGAIKVVALIDCCIRELSKFDINYFQGPEDGRAFIHDLITENSAFVDINFDNLKSRLKMNPKIVATSSSTTTTTVTEKPDGGDPTNYCSIMHSSGSIILGATEKPDGGDPTNQCSIM